MIIKHHILKLHIPELRKIGQYWLSYTLPFANQEGCALEGDPRGSL